MAQSINLGEGNVRKLLFKLAIPSITAQLINILYNIVDKIYIGHMDEIGQLALTGLGICLPLITIVMAFAALVAVGSASRASISLGRGDTNYAEKVLGNSLVLMVVISVVLTAAIQIFGRDILMFFGASEATISYAWDYMQIYSLGSMSVLVALGLNAFIACQGFTTISMLSVLIGAIANIILDPIFIFVFNLGVKGAAIATIISQTISVVWIVSFLLGKKTKIRLKPQNLKLSPSVILPCIALGLSPFIMQATESLINIVFNRQLYFYGGDLAVGAMTIIVSIMQFMFLPIQGLVQGAQPIMSFNYGAGNAERCKKAFKVLLTTCLIYSITFGASILTFPELFTSIFNNNIELVDFTSKAMRIYFCGTLIFGIQMACQNTFIAIGNAKVSIFLALLRKIILLIPLLYIMPLILTGNQLMAVFVAEPIADTISVITAGTTFFFSFRKSMANLEKSGKPLAKAV